MTYSEIKGKHNLFVYDKYEISELESSYEVTFYFEIVGLKKFTPKLEIDKEYITNSNININFVKELVFHIGLVELISYWKCAMPQNVIIKAGYLSEQQINWWKKLYFHGLGEFFYTNNIDVNIDDFMNITCEGISHEYSLDYQGSGNLIAIGGGKDSVVSMNVLKDMYDENDVFMINPKYVHLKCAEVGGYENKKFVVKRTLDKGIVELNQKGYLNGHTPFSSLVSFVSLLTAYLGNKKYIVLSNESSANESNVEGTKINHQYSKSYEYECDFNNYVSNYLKIDIHYFSLLRPLAEIQIAKLFAKYKEYHSIFKSCNQGSKKEPWCWCCNCPKCLFVYIILSPFLSDEEMISIFGENLYNKEELLNTFIELTGNSLHKPFECVGTYEEVNLALRLKIKQLDGNLPYLLDYYKNNYLKDCDESLLNGYNEENNLPNKFVNILKGELNENN